MRRDSAESHAQGTPVAHGTPEAFREAVVHMAEHLRTLPPIEDSQHPHSNRATRQGYVYIHVQALAMLIYLLSFVALFLNYIKAAVLYMVVRALLFLLWRILFIGLLATYAQ